MKTVERWASTRWGKVIAGTLFAVLMLWQGGKMHREVMEAGRKHNNDYECWMIGARAVMNGDDVFAVRTAGRGRRNPCLPWFCMAMVPFVAMGYTASSVVWPLANLLALAASSYWCLKAARGIDAPVPWPLWIVPPLLVIRALDSNSGLGQINVLILAAASAGVYCYVRGRAAAAGMALGAATLVKATPGLLLVYAAWRRRWKVVAWAAAIAVVLVLVAPMPIYGVLGGYESFCAWLEKRVFQPPGEGSFVGQSLRGLAYRFLTDSRASPSYRREDIRVNVASLSFATAETAYRLTSAVVLVVMGILTRGRGDRSRVAGHLALVLAAMLLLTPHNRKAHYVLLMLPMTYVYSHLALCDRWRGRERLLLVLAVLSFALTGLTARGIIGKRASAYCDAWATMGWGCLLLFVGIVVLLGRPRVAGPLEVGGEASGPRPAGRLGG